MSKTGYCRFCNQMHIIEGNTGDPDVIATAQCECSQAAHERAYQEKRQKQILQTCESIHHYFGGEGPFPPLGEETAAAVTDMLMNAVEPVVDGLIDKITIALPDCVKAIIANKGKKITVERVDTSKHKDEI